MDRFHQTLKVKNRYLSGFTIVELLVVIVVIAVLAAITFVSYVGISSRANAAAMQSDLKNASNLMKLFQVEKTSYPATIDCSQPDSSTNKCISLSNGGVYEYKVSSRGNSFCLEETKNSVSYNMTQDGTLLTGPCPVLYLDPANSLSYPGSGTMWMDLSGYDNDATLINGLGYNSTDKTMVFDGADDYGLINHSTMFDTNQLTIAVWVEAPATLGLQFRAFFSKQGADRDYNFYAYSPTSAAITGMHFSSSRFGSSFTTLPSSYTGSSWHFVAVTVDGFGLVKYYSDGVLINSVQGVAASASSGYPIKIGAADNYWIGEMGKVIFYNKTLTAAEVKGLYDATKM